MKTTKFNKWIKESRTYDARNQGREQERMYMRKNLIEIVVGQGEFCPYEFRILLLKNSKWQYHK